MQVLELTFQSQAGKTVRITLDAPKTSLTSEEVKTTMEEMIAENVFVDSDGSPIAIIKGARVVERTVTDFTVA